MQPPIDTANNGSVKQISGTSGVTTSNVLSDAPMSEPRGRDPLFRARSRPAPQQWADDEPMTLAEAAAVFFPEGQPLTLRSLRTAAETGELAIAKVAGKSLTTPGAVRAMLTPKRSAKSAESHHRDDGPYSTAQAAEEATLRAIRQSLQSHRPTRARP